MTFEEAKQVVAHGRGMGLMNLICLFCHLKLDLQIWATRSLIK